MEKNIKLLYLENCFHAVCNPPFQSIFPIRARRCWVFNPDHTSLSKAFAQGDSQQFQRGNHSIAPTCHACSLLQKEQLANSQHNYKILFPMKNPPHYPLLFSHQKSLYYHAKKICRSCFVQYTVATREKSYFPFSHAHSSLLCPCHTGHSLLCPLQGPYAELHKGIATKEIFCSHRIEITMIFQTSLPTCVPGKARTRIREGMGTGEGRRDEQITV